MRVLFLSLFLFAFAPHAMAAESANIFAPRGTEAHTHYCPMHPEETGVAGDECPICGMNLVPMEEQDKGAPDDHNHEMRASPIPSTDADARPDGIYICPMHPHISGEEGENCPICGMKLVPKEEKGSSGEKQNAMPDGAFMIDPAYIQTLGVKTVSVTHHEFGKSIRAFGEVAPSMRNEVVVAMRSEGWIADLETSAIGDTVKKGDLLFTYYSPDLMAAQSDYLRGNRVGNQKQRLRQYGMDDKAIGLLETENRMMDATPFYAPVDGTIIDLEARKGAFMEEGDMAMAIQDFSQVWVNADMPIRDLQFLEAGQKAIIIVPETGKTYESSIDFIHPVADPQTRTGMIRLVIDNPDAALKPDVYVDTIVHTEAQMRLAVPSEAVLYGNMGAYVIEALGNGSFRPVMVETGITAHGLTEITNGLSHGQNIVKSGQFMLDAESNLKGGMAAMEHDYGK